MRVGEGAFVIANRMAREAIPGKTITAEPFGVKVSLTQFSQNQVVSGPLSLIFLPLEGGGPRWGWKFKKEERYKKGFPGFNRSVSQKTSFTSRLTRKTPLLQI